MPATVLRMWDDSLSEEPGRVDIIIMTSFFYHEVSVMEPGYGVCVLVRSGGV